MIGFTTRKKKENPKKKKYILKGWLRLSGWVGSQRKKKKTVFPPAGVWKSSRRGRRPTKANKKSRPRVPGWFPPPRAFGPEVYGRLPGRSSSAPKKGRLRWGCAGREERVAAPEWFSEHVKGAVSRSAKDRRGKASCCPDDE